MRKGGMGVGTVMGKENEMERGWDMDMDNDRDRDRDKGHLLYSFTCSNFSYIFCDYIIYGRRVA